MFLADRRSFEIVVDLQNRDHESQVVRHRLMQRENVETLVLDFDFHPVDLAVGFDHDLSQLLIAMEQRLNRPRQPPPPPMSRHRAALASVHANDGEDARPWNNDAVFRPFPELYPARTGPVHGS